MANAFIQFAMKRPAPVLTKAEWTKVLNEHLYYEIVHALGVCVYEQRNYFAWELVNYSRIGHARVLIKFFDPDKGDRERDDDIICTDFGFPIAPFNFDPEDRKRWGKDLFHLSVERLRYGANPKKKPWPNIFLNKVHERAKEFTRHILSASSTANFDADRNSWEVLLGELESGHEITVDIGLFPSGALMGYAFARGRLLPGGLSDHYGCPPTDPDKWPPRASP